MWKLSSILLIVLGDNYHYGIFMRKPKHGESSLMISRIYKLFVYEFRWCMTLMTFRNCYKYYHNLKAEKAEVCFIYVKVCVIGNGTTISLLASL